MKIDLNFGKNQTAIENAYRFMLIYTSMILNKSLKLINVRKQNEESVVRMSVNGELYDYFDSKIPHIAKVIKENQR